MTSSMLGMKNAGFSDARIAELDQRRPEKAYKENDVAGVSR